MPRPRLEGTTRLDRLIAYISPARAAKRQTARLRFQMAAQFRGADTSRLLSDWLTQSMGIVNPDKAELQTLRERTQELNRNNPLSSSITDTLMVNVIGQGLQPQSRLRAKELGISAEEAKDLRRQAENIFDRWQKQEKFRNKQAVAFRKVVEDGEIIANLPAPENSEAWRFLRRRVELIEADRLGGAAFFREGVFQGIEVDQDTKEPKKYWIRKANLTTNEYEIPRYEWAGIPARDSRGRPLILHNFLVKRPGQLRGIPFLAPALVHFKHLGDYFHSTVVTAKLAAFISLVITTSDPTGSIPLARQTGLPGATLGGGGAPKEIWEPASVLRLGLGETATLMDPKNVQESFGPFMEVGQRILGACAGMPYELLLKDFSKTNYSSARAALLEARRWFMFLRAWFGWEHCQPIWELVLEEAYLAGEFHAKNFYQFQDEYCRAQWIGGGWGWVDPVKEVGASIAAILARLSTHADELAGQGKDWEDVFEQLVQEQQYAKALGLAELATPKSFSTQGEAKESEDPQPGNPQGQAHLMAILGYLATIAASSKEMEDAA